MLWVVSKHDARFHSKYAENAKWKTFKHCVHFGHFVLPQMASLERCLNMLGIRRPTEQSLREQKWDFSVLWSPISRFPISYVREHDDLSEYEGIPPFSWQMNWGVNGGTLLAVDREGGELPFNETTEFTAKNLTKILDKTFILHLRQSPEGNPVVKEAVAQMESVRE